MNLDHIFIDLAVTDPNPEKGKIIALAAVRTDKRGNVLAAFSDETSTGGEYSEALFKKSIAAMESAILAKRFEMSYIVVAHFAEVDRRFLTSAYEAASLGIPFPKRAWLDTAQMAWPLVYNDMIAERTLDSLCVHFGIERKAETYDTAMGDCEALVRVYWAMMARYRGALQGEELVRNVGGETLAKARKMFGGLF